jgi:FkbM family methyltransferase
MNLEQIQIDSLNKWGSDNGNFTHALNFNIDENSIVVDLGAYKGVWAQQIIDRYNPHVYLFEPVPEFYESLLLKFQDNLKVRVFNFGISTINKKDFIYVNNDATSSYITSNNKIEVNFIDFDSIFEVADFENIDLIQINIEGEEYPLLQKISSQENIKKLKNIQIQYHIWIEDAFVKRDNIQNEMSKNFNKTYDYPFVFEGWKLK